MIGTATIPPKMAGEMLFPAVLMGISGDVQMAGVVGQLQVEGSCVTTTPVKKNKIGHFLLLWLKTYKENSAIFFSTWWSRLCLLPLK